MTRILAVDPGTEKSAFVGWNGLGITVHATLPNATVLTNIREDAFGDDMVLVLERIESFGMPVGREVLRTVFWCGRFAEAWEQAGGTFAELSRKDVKLHLCGSSRATDANVRAAILDRFGGKEKAIGKKAAPGPLYGLKGHEFSALAVGLTYYDQSITQHLPVGF